MGILLWIIFGSLVGWGASLVIRSNTSKPHIGTNVIIGIFGALLGGIIMSATLNSNVLALSIETLFVALGSAIAMIYCVSVLRQ